MTTSSTSPPSLGRKLAAWGVHLLTASGAVLGLFSFYFIAQKNYTLAFAMFGITIAIDAIDGTFARLARTKETLPWIDGALLDNMIDYLNYVIAPAFFVLTSTALAPGWREALSAAIVLSSSYQFTQVDAKTDDHYFKGFPSYWNIAAFYLYFWQLGPHINAAILGALVVLIFVPVKYIYPTRLQYFTPHRWFRVLILLATWVWGAVSFSLVFLYPTRNPWLIGISLGYCVLYGLFSFYRTLYPLPLEHTPDAPTKNAGEP